MTLATKDVYEYLATMVNYDQTTGIFTWNNRIGDDSITKKWNDRYAGTQAGTKSHGYILIGITVESNKIKIRAHRLAWFIVNGTIPSEQIDHINHDRSDNRISNLRDVSNHENSKNRSIQSNNSSGFTGVSWSKYAKKWYAFCKINGKKKHLGYFDDANSANIVVLSYRLKNGFDKLHGENK